MSLGISIMDLNYYTKVYWGKYYITNFKFKTRVISYTFGDKRDDKIFKTNDNIT